MAFLLSTWLPTSRLRLRQQTTKGFPLRHNVKTSASKTRATLSTSEDAAPSPNSTPSSTTSSQTYNWLDQWFPVEFEENVKDNDAYSFQIFDKPYILVRDVTGSYTVMDDKCPHRAAPLSEGRVFTRKTREGEQTIIECGYHGWRFGCNGNCLDIPSKSGEPGKSAHIRGVYKTDVAPFGLIFVWLGNPDAAPPLPLPKGLQPSSKRPVIFYRELHRRIPLPFDILVENVVDPSHVPWAHHKSDGDRRKSSIFQVPVRVADHDPSRAYFRSILSDAPATYELSLQGILIVYCRSPDEHGDPQFYIPIWVVPQTRNLTSIFVVRILFNPTLKTKLRAILAPRWRQHAMSNLVFDGDNPLLHSVYRNLTHQSITTGKPGWRKLYLLSETEGDGLVAAFRIWYDSIRHQVPFALPPSTLVPDPISRFHINDRFHWHTKHCVVCSTALRNFRIFSRVSRIMALLAVFGALTTALCCSAFALGQPAVAKTFANYSKTLFLIGVVMVGAAIMADRGILSYTYTDQARRLLTTPDTTF